MLEYIFYAATPILMFSSLPQTAMLIRTKDSKSISALTYALTWLGVGLLLARAVTIGDTALTFGNGVSFMMVTINLSLILRYKQK